MASAPTWSNTQNVSPQLDTAAVGVVYRFGPFRLSTVDRLLRRESEVVSLPPRVVDTLLVLVEAEGDLVTKETLLERVWGSVYVDPNSITQNISRLRRTLDEYFSESPIATLPKRGYRFVAEITREAPRLRSAASDVHALADVAIALPELEIAPSMAPATVMPSIGSAPWRVFAVALLIMVIALSGLEGWKAYKGRDVVLTVVRPSVAILGFDDLAGTADSKTAWIGTALQETLYSEIGADPAVRLISNSAVSEMRRSLKLESATRLSPDVQASMRKILGCDLVVKGHYLSSDGKLRVDIVLEDARTGETVGTFSHTDSSDHLLRVIAASGQDLRARLGMPTLNGVQTGTLLASLTTEPQALQAYAEGVARLRGMDPVGAKAFLEQAILNDPSYPLAHVALSEALSMLGYDQNAAAEARKALDLSRNLSQEEKLAVRAQYATASSKWEDAITASKELFRLYPDNVQYGLGLMHVLDLANKPHEGLAVATVLKKLPQPVGGDPRIALAEANAYTTTGDVKAAIARAQAAVAGARERNLGFVLADALLTEGDAIDRMGQHDNARGLYAEAKAIASGNGDRAFEVKVMRKDAGAARQLGDLVTARNELNEAITASRELGDRRGVVAGLSNLTQVYRAEGDLPAQKQLTLEILAIAHDLNDRGLQASAQLDLGNELNNMGDPAGGRQAYQKALATAREVGDGKTESRAVGNLGILEYTHGNLVLGQSYIEQGLALSRKMGESSSVAYKLGHYASVLMYQGKLKEAQVALDEKCALSEKAGEKSDVGSCKLESAVLTQQRGDTNAAIAQLEWITANYTTHTPALDAWKALARMRLEIGDLAGAKIALDRATEMATHTVNEADFLIPIALIRGRLQTRMRQDGEAAKTLQTALDRAKALGLIPLELQARRAIAELHMKRDKKKAGEELGALATDAEHLGFKPMAQAVRTESSE